MKKTRQFHNGFTFIELILYVGMAGALLTLMSMLLFSLLEGRIKNQTVAELEQEGDLAIYAITQAVRNGSSINSPAAGSSASSLSLNTYDAAKNPTVFDLSGGAMRITEGSGSAVALTTSRVTASAVTFQNLARPGTPGIIRIQFTFTAQNTIGRNEYSYNKIFYATANGRY